MNRGARVIFTARWSSYFGKRGRVTSPSPNLRVLLDGETKDEAVRADEVAEDYRTRAWSALEDGVSMTGAE